jgi:hypothetical protein
MTRNLQGRSTLKRARWAFWACVGIAMLAAGSLSAGLGAAPSPLTGLRVAVSGIALIAALALAARVMIALERARRRSR